MKKSFFIIPLLSLLVFTSCDMFDNGDVTPYVGEYVLETANEKTYHIYWSQKELKYESNLNLDIKRLTIKEDKTVEYTTKDGEVKTGKIRVYDDYCKFSGTPIDSDYKFIIRYDGAIYYSYESSHFGVEYDVTYRHILFTKYEEDNGGITLFRKEDTRYKQTEYVIGLTPFDVIVKNKDGSVNENIQRQHCYWTTGDSKIATVDSSGNVSPQKGGETTLTVMSGNYTDTINIKTAIFTTKFDVDSTIVNYEVGKTYDMPISMDKTGVTVFYTVDDNDIISITDNSFKALRSGTVTVNASAFTSVWGDTKEISFTLEIREKNAPYFEFENRSSTSGSGTIPKNKYSAIPYNSLEIYAYTYQHEDISSSIIVKSGDYDLTKSGTYDVVISAIDPATFISSDFALKLTVTDYEIKKTLSPYDAVHIDSASYELVDKPISFAIDHIIFRMKVTLDERYDTSDAKVTAAFYFKIKEWGSSSAYYRYDYTGEPLKVSQSFVYNGARSLEFEYDLALPQDCDPDTFVYEGANPIISGYVYNFVTY